MIFCVEDDTSIRDLMIYALQTSGFEARGFNDGGELSAALEEAGRTGEDPELIMLDIMLPGEDGMEILRKLKADPATERIPVIMATAKGTEFDKVIGLDTGADDYLTKPFGMMEMIARVNAVLRRTEHASKSDTIRIGKLAVNKDARKVTSGEEEINLTLKEFEVLQLFMQNPGHVFTREKLLSAVWGIEYPGETRTVDVHIGTLRTKLGEYGRYIETVRGVGYRFSGEER